METKILADIIGYIAALIGSLMFMPQAYQIWKTKDTSGVSLMSYFLLLVVSILWVIYGSLMQATPVIIVNSIITVLSLYIVFMKVRNK